LCATSYGPRRTITSLHLGFEQRDLSPGEARDIQLAGLVLTEHLMDFTVPPADDAPALTPRERDVLALVADGKSDWKISALLKVSEATVRFHLNNARRKLGAVNRSHAVAKLMSRGLI
jgi:DNA-binding CsgD family transcriptional regulator